MTTTHEPTAPAATSKDKDKSPKRPAFQFYPADWRKDAALQSCSVAARGLWIEMMCIAHECLPYGHLTVNGKPMARTQIARLTGMGEATFKRLLGELIQAGVCSVAEDGTIFSRRMVRDETLRAKRVEGGQAGGVHGPKGKEHGSKGGRPAQSRGDLNPPFPTEKYPPLKPSPSSSTSTSSSDKNPPCPPMGDGHGWLSILPDGWQSIPRDERRGLRVLRNSPLMERIGRWFDRPADSRWALAEGIALAALQPAVAEVDLLENYYLARISPDRDYRRRDLGRLLAHWPAELDRARVWMAELGGEITNHPSSHPPSK
ncbi:hypothetical protein [Haloferula sp. BvORR071]|uniref:hypothetical protein n=1 Tax=Haloferula sp. BvORR071 TaxID=1396141 RepID=UPI00069746C2|nr:hypothetical protein [Haloferula sp. BvORR071]